MGIFHGRDLYSAKWLTAEIDDHGSRRWIIPIKHTIGKYFLAKIDKLYYCFEVDLAAIKTYRGLGPKVCPLPEL